MKSKLMKAAEVYPEARLRVAELRRIERMLEGRLQNCPQGKIHLVPRSNRVMYYLRRSPSERSGVYISARDEKTIRTYLQKEYDERLLPIVKQEIRELEKFLAADAGFPDQIRDLYLAFPERARKYIDAVDLPDGELEQNWRDTAFEPKEVSDIPVKLVTEKGEHVRSKSELNIANALNRRKVPYRYECPLRLRGGTIYPDFTILNVRKRKVLYWEHRGMMDDRDYARRAVWRLKEYQQNQIYPGARLIITEETSASPLGTDEIYAIIREYCL